jgi:hypothetical protein
MIVEDVGSISMRKLRDCSPMSSAPTFTTKHGVRMKILEYPSVRPGVVKTLKFIQAGPVGLVHTQKIEAQSEKPTWTKALEFTQFACPCGTDPRLLSGEQRTSHFKLVTSVDDPTADIGSMERRSTITRHGRLRPPSYWQPRLMLRMIGRSSIIWRR